MRCRIRLPGQASLFLFAACIAPAAVGCYPVTHLQGPRTVAPGEFQGAIATGFQHSGRERKSRGFPLDLALRYGVLDAIDVSARARPALTRLDEWGYELGAKFQLLRDDVELSIAPSIVLARFERDFLDEQSVPAEDQANFRFGRVAVLLGTDADDLASVWLAPTIDLGMRQFPVKQVTITEPLVALGSCAGLGLRIGAHAQFVLQAGVTVGAAGRSVVVDYGRNNQPMLSPGDLIAEATIGLSVGGFRD